MTAPLVIIVAYGAESLLSECLRRLAGHQPVVVVDNGDSSTTRQLAEEAGHDYVRSPRNLGFAGGVNVGLAHSWDGRRDVLLLNPDAQIGPGQIGALQAALHSVERRAAVGPMLARPDGRAEPASWPMPSPAQVWADALGLGRFLAGTRFVTGACLMLSGAAISELGGLDERYFLYAEETDWQLRAIRAGWTVAVDATTTVTHLGGGSSSNPAVRARHFHRSSRLLAERWYPGWGAYSMRLGRIVAACRRWLTQPASRVEQRELLRVCLARGNGWDR